MSSNRLLVIHVNLWVRQAVEEAAEEGQAEALAPAPQSTGRCIELALSPAGLDFKTGYLGVISIASIAAFEFLVSLVEIYCLTTNPAVRCYLCLSQ